MFIPRQKIVIYVALSLIIVFPILGNAEGTVIINEVAWMGSPPESDENAQQAANDEWIEMHNLGATPVDLTGWTLKSADGNPTINLSGNIEAGGYFLLSRNEPAVNGVAADLVYPYDVSKSSLANSGEHLKLLDPQNNVVDEINASSKWPAGNNETKQTMEWTGSTWKTSLNPGGTPRAQNSVHGTDAPGNQGEESPQPPPADSSTDSASSPQPSQGQSNQAPKAKAETDKTEAAVNETITFDASGSSDVNGDTLSFSWNFGDPVPETSSRYGAGGNRAEGEVVTHTYQEPGTYNVVLMVSDGELESYDYLTVNVTAAPPEGGASLAPAEREPAYSSQIFINEFLPSPSGPDEENEWIEIVNESSIAVDLSRWQIDDEEGGSKPFTVPEGTKIGPGAFLVFGRPQTKIALNNDGDSVRLMWPNGFAAHEVNYDKKTKEGWSAARFSSSWEWTNSPTPGSANILSYDTKTAATNKNSLSTRSSTLTSTVNSPPDAFSERDGGSGSTTARTVEDAGNLEPALQKAEARTPFSVLPAKYSAGVVALLVSLAGALAIFILKKRLKTPF